MRFYQSIIFLAVCLCIIIPQAIAQNSIKEPSTEKSFPAEVKYSYNSKDYTLQCTGLAVRKKIVFKVYGIAHYMEGMYTVNNKKEAYPIILTEGKAKEIMMVFVRDVDAKTIRETYHDGFKNNTSDTGLKEIQPMMEKFLGYFLKDVKENDSFVFRWIPGGTIVVIINNEEQPAITNELFARTLWSIWFGEDSVVDRDKLVARMTGK